ncbi:hypothetical protein [Chryseobacterium sp.]|uniref:hypothetical protein n=1 Tax=Chryseobacterium sp. TaxID=1871047 RepID=UPI00388E8B05
MKKIFLYILAGSLCLSACKKDDEVETYVEPENIATQNAYDDEAIQKFLNDNYLDALGNIKSFSSSDDTDDNEVKLADLNPQTLPTGAIYIVRNNVQPTNGTTVGDKDVLRLMMRAKAYLAGSTDGKVTFLNSMGFTTQNPLDESGSPLVDPTFYYVKESVLTASGKDRSYYEMEGFQEAIRKFKAFDKTDDENYNLQGVIIVPSRAAFARDPHSTFGGTYSYRNCTFIFNFQLYKSSTRLASEM